VYVKGLTSVYVSSPEETLEVMKVGTSNRAIAATSEFLFLFLLFVFFGDLELEIMILFERRHERGEFTESLCDAPDDQPEESQGWLEQIWQALSG